VSDLPTKAGGSWAQTLILAVVAAALTFAAALVMFSAFMYYDDEGYVLISLRNFVAHGGLYRDVYSQYGPFPFVFYYGLDALGFPLTHVGGRVVTLAAWAGCAVGAAALVQVATRHFILSLAVLIGVFPYLWIMVSEPSHPGGLIAVATAIAAAFGYRFILLGRPRAWALLTGAIAAALALTKINVGGFVVLSALSWIGLHQENPRGRRWAPVLIGIGSMVVPLVLMRPMLGIEWVQVFVLVFACAGLAAAFTAPADTAPGAGAPTLGWCIVGGLGMTAVVLGVVFARGTSPHDLINGVLIAPLKHPTAYNLRYTWAAGTAAFAIGSLVVCGLALLLRRRGVAVVEYAVAVLRLGAAVGVGYAVLRYPDSSPAHLVFGYGAPSLWLFLWPLPGELPRARAARTWLGLLWLGQFLHAFPVAGSQVSWGTFLAVPLAAVGASEALVWLAGQAAFPAHARRTATLTLRGALVLLAVSCSWRFAGVAARYRQGSDLALPGAEILRLPTEATALFRLLSLNATVHGDMLFTEPGMFSFNFWSQLPTPTLANVTHWFSLLDASQQAAIIRALEAHPRACIIRQRDHMNYLAKRNFAPAGALHDYLAHNFSPAFILDDFEFCVRNGRTIAPLFLGEMLVLGDAPAAENTALKLRLLLPPGQAVQRIELSSPRRPDDGHLNFDATNSRLEIIPADAGGPAQAAAWPLRLTESATVLVHFNRFTQPRPVAGGLITLRGADGAEIALARLKQ
jgi:hypothetical protein